MAPSSTEEKKAPEPEKAQTPQPPATPTVPADKPQPVEPKAPPVAPTAPTTSSKLVIPPATLTITVKAPTGKTTEILLTEKPAVGKGSESNKPGSTLLNAPSTQSSPSHKEPETTTGTTATHKKPDPVDPHQLLLEPLKLCLQDWALIHVKVSDLECPSGSMAHWEKLFTKAATLQLDSKVRNWGNTGLCLVKNMRKLITANQTILSKDYADKIAGRLYAIGSLLTCFANKLGISEVTKGMSFAKQTPVDDIAPKMSAIKKTAPSSVGKTPTSESVLTPQKLQEAAAALKKVQESFGVVMSGLVGASDGVKAYEIVSGLCAKGGVLQKDATRILHEIIRTVENFSKPANTQK